jgi:hypothetical protein
MCLRTAEVRLAARESEGRWAPACRNRRQRFSRENSRDPSREFSTPGRAVAITVPPVLCCRRCRSWCDKCTMRGPSRGTREWSPEIAWVVPSDRDRTYFRQNCSQEFLAGYLAAYRVEFRSQPGRSCGPWRRSSCRLWPRPSTWSRVECARSTAPSRPCWSYAENDELWSRKHGTTGYNAQLVCLLDGAAIYISGPLPGCTHDAKGISPPRRSPRLSRTPVAGSWIRAQRHQRWRSDLLCAATERGTLRTRRCAATHARPTLARWRGDRGHRLGRTQQFCFYEGGSPSTGGSDSGAERSASASTRYVAPTLPRPQLRAGR